MWKLQIRNSKVYAVKISFTRQIKIKTVAGKRRRTSDPNTHVCFRCNLPSPGEHRKTFGSRPNLGLFRDTVVLVAPVDLRHEDSVDVLM